MKCDKCGADNIVPEELRKLPPEANELAAMMRDAARYRWLNNQHNFMAYIESESQLRRNVRLRCGLPLDEWIDKRITEEQPNDSVKP